MHYLHGMDDETRAAFAALNATVAGLGQIMIARTDQLRDDMIAGFARTDHFFELQQAQHVELRGDFAELRGDFAELRGDFAELRGEVRELSDRVESLTERVSRLENEVSQLRDYVTREISDIRIELRTLRERSDATNELRRDIAKLAVRVDHIEERHQD
jgi:chromosome segregation ATPase